MPQNIPDHLQRNAQIYQQAGARVALVVAIHIEPGLDSGARESRFSPSKLICSKMNSSLAAGPG
jgi:hypothetical protein